MYNEYSDCHRRRAINTMIKTGGPAMTEVLVGFEDFHHFFDEPASNLMYPVFNHFEEENKSMVGFVTVTFHWLGTFWNILPQNIVGIVAVIETSSGQKSSFRVNGKHVSVSSSAFLFMHLSSSVLTLSYVYMLLNNSFREYSLEKEIITIKNGDTRDAAQVCTASTQKKAMSKKW